MFRGDAVSHWQDIWPEISHDNELVRYIEEIYFEDYVYDDEWNLTEKQAEFLKVFLARKAEDVLHEFYSWYTNMPWPKDFDKALNDHNSLGLTRSIGYAVRDIKEGVNIKEFMSLSDFDSLTLLREKPSKTKNSNLWNKLLAHREKSGYYENNKVDYFDWVI